MEGKTSSVASLCKDLDEEDTHVSRLGVNNFKNFVKKHLFIFM